MHMKPGLRVVCRNVTGKGQVTAVRDGTCQVIWPGGRRQSHPECELIAVGMRVTCGGKSGRVVGLGRERIRVRFADGACYWMRLEEIAPRESKRLEQTGEGELENSDSREVTYE